MPRLPLFGWGRLGAGIATHDQEHEPLAEGREIAGADDGQHNEGNQPELSDSQSQHDAILSRAQMLGSPGTPISPVAGSAVPLDVVVGLGSNLGARSDLLELGVAGLAKIGSVVGLSSVYETAPVGPPQPHFLNAAARLASELSPNELLAALLEIERLAGRERRERWGPRTLDLDLLWIRGRSIEEPGLSIPHARLHERPFALLPLLDVAPDAADPRTGAPYAAIALTLDCAGVRRLSSDEFRWSPLAAGG